MTGPLRDIKAAAEWLGISPRTLEQYVSARTVPFTKVGRLIRFSDEHLHAIVAAGEQRPRGSSAALALARPVPPPSRQPGRPSTPPPAPRPPAGPATPAPPPGPKTNPAAEATRSAA